VSSGHCTHTSEVEIINFAHQFSIIEFFVIALSLRHTFKKHNSEGIAMMEQGQDDNNFLMPEPQGPPNLFKMNTAQFPILIVVPGAGQVQVNVSERTPVGVIRDTMIQEGAGGTGRILFNGNEVGDNETMEEVHAVIGSTFTYELPVEEPSYDANQ
jgi:hypothetical protein